MVGFGLATTFPIAVLFRVCCGLSQCVFSCGNFFLLTDSTPEYRAKYSTRYVFMLLLGKLYTNKFFLDVCTL